MSHGCKEEAACRGDQRPSLALNPEIASVCLCVCLHVTAGIYFLYPCAFELLSSFDCVSSEMLEKHIFLIIKSTHIL